MGNNGSRRLPFYIIPMPLRSLHSFCSVRSHLLKSLERQILHIWEQREAFTPYWEQREYHHMEGTEEAWNMNMSMGGSESLMHACMHACNMQHSHVHMDARNTHAPMRHTAHNTTHTSHAQVLNQHGSFIVVASCIDFYVVLLLIFWNATYDKTLLTRQSDIGCIFHMVSSLH